MDCLRVEQPQTMCSHPRNDSLYPILEENLQWFCFTPFTQLKKNATIMFISVHWIPRLVRRQGSYWERRALVLNVVFQSGWAALGFLLLKHTVWGRKWGWSTGGPQPGVQGRCTVWKSWMQLGDHGFYLVDEHAGQKYEVRHRGEPYKLF